MTDDSPRADLYVALMHFPVLNKEGDIVTSSVTTLDVHDLSRICRTYAVKTFYIVTPLEAQHQLVDRMVRHWKTGFGSTYNPTRKEALTGTVVKKNLDEVMKEIEQGSGRLPKTLIPDTRSFPQSVSYEEGRQLLKEGEGPFIMLLGTGWGLERNTVERADYILAPIDGINGYNHLRVRAAAAVILDRLLSKGS